MIEEMCHFEDEDDGTCAACSYGLSCGCCAPVVRWADCPVNKLQTELDAARAELAEWRAAAQRNADRAESYVRQLEAAEDHLDAVIALHFDSGAGYCAECSSSEDGIEVPCPTVRAAATVKP